MEEIVAGKLYQTMAPWAEDILSNPAEVARLGLKAILTTAHDIKIKVPSTLIHLCLPVDEISETPTLYFDLACNLNVYPLLVHCLAGANRSRVFAAAIACFAFGIPMEEALRRADPPEGIVLRSMKNWASRIRGATTRRVTNRERS